MNMTTKDKFKVTKKWFGCDTCQGFGKIKDYEDTWKCPACDGEGGHFVDRHEIIDPDSSDSFEKRKQ